MMTTAELEARLYHLVLIYPPKHPAVIQARKELQARYDARESAERAWRRE
jgi:hypothetical protein